MKKTILLILTFAGILIPLNSTAQKKGSTSKKQPRVAIPTAPNLKSEMDTLSYAMGSNLVQGLPQYLIMLGVVVDTAAISAEYNGRISAETDPAKKTSLEKTFRTKMDSASTANTKNMPPFINGFTQSMKETKHENILFNNGIAVGDQVKSMVKRFSGEGLDQDLNMDLLLAGFITGLRNEKSLIDNPQEVMERVMGKAQEEKAKIAAEAMKAQYADKLASEAKFMEENKAKSGIITRPSGLQYKIIKEGDGSTPKVNQRVKVHYHGMLLDGTVFDSSVDRGEPAEFNVGQLIRGWNEALLIMPQGSKWTLYIPYELAYGEREMAVIKPFSNLIFEVELLEVEEQSEN